MFIGIIIGMAVGIALDRWYPQPVGALVRTVQGWVKKKPDVPPPNKG
jgi:hypothetical protein